MSSLVARGDRVVATARNSARDLQHLNGPNVSVLDLDVTAEQSDLDAIVAKALKVFGGVDVLVNNAAYLRGGLMEEQR